MIREFTDRYIRNQEYVKNVFREHKPESYAEIIRAVVDCINDDYMREKGRHILRGTVIEIDPNKDNCDTEGVLVYVLPGVDDGKDTLLYYVQIEYGSCSGCDTLKGIKETTGESPSEPELKQYMTLALHVAQAIKPMDAYVDCNLEDAVINIDFQATIKPSRLFCPPKDSVFIMVNNSAGTSYFCHEGVSPEDKFYAFIDLIVKLIKNECEQ